MEKEFKDWYEENAIGFSYGQLDKKRIAYLAWLEGRNQALSLGNNLIDIKGDKTPDYYWSGYELLVKDEDGNKYENETSEVHTHYDIEEHEVDREVLQFPHLYFDNYHTWLEKYGEDNLVIKRIDEDSS